MKMRMNIVAKTRVILLYHLRFILGGDERRTLLVAITSSNLKRDEQVIIKQKTKQVNLDGQTVKLNGRVGKLRRSSR